MTDASRRQTGFTIVELLIVIVVIGILAAITIAAYNGVKDKANNTAVQSDVRQFVGKVLEYQATDGTYPVGNQGAAPTGIPKFKVSLSAYDTSVHNFWYCTGTVGGVERFGVGGLSASGKSYIYTSDGGMKEATGGWSLGGNTGICPLLGVPVSAVGYTYSYGYNKDTVVWFNWVK